MKAVSTEPLASLPFSLPLTLTRQSLPASLKVHAIESQWLVIDDAPDDLPSVEVVVHLSSSIAAANRSISMRTVIKKSR